MSGRLCKLFLNYIGNILFYVLLIALLGAIFLFFALLVGGLIVWHSSPSLAAALAAIFALPTWGTLAAVGLVLFVGGLLFAFALIVIYVLLLVVCCSVAGNVDDRVGAVAGTKRDACDCGPLCLLGPLFPAASFLILVLVVTPILLFSTGRWDSAVTPDRLVAAATTLFVLFGLLLALAPVIWCCCRGCKKTTVTIPPRASAALAVDPSELTGP